MFGGFLTDQLQNIGLLQSGWFHGEAFPTGAYDHALPQPHQRRHTEKKNAAVPGRTIAFRFMKGPTMEEQTISSLHWNRTFQRFVHR